MARSLGSMVRAPKPCTRPAGVGDGERDAALEEVLGRAAAHPRQAGLDQLVAREALPQGPAREHRSPARREAHAEAAQQRLVEAPSEQVLAGGGGLVGAPQVGGVEAGGALQQVGAPVGGGAGRLLLGARPLVAQRHPEALGQRLDRLGEGAGALALAHPVDGVARGPAAEAVVRAVVRRDDRERRGPLLVERAPPDPPTAPAHELDLPPDQLHQVGRLAHRLDALGIDQRHVPESRTAPAAPSARGYRVATNRYRLRLKK